MGEPILLSPQELVGIFLAICGAIITISGAITVIIKFVEHARKPNKKQDERISALEEEVKNIHDRLKLGNKRFETDTERVDAMEQQMKESNRVIIESLQALISHAINGNNTQSLKEAKKTLDEYLLNKV